MATDPTGGAPFTVGQRLLSAVMNLVRANQLIQLDTDGGTRAMTNPLILSGTKVLSVADEYAVVSRSETRFVAISGTYNSTNAASVTVGAPAVQTTTTTSSEINVPLNDALESGSTLTRLGFWFKAAAGGASHHSGALGVVPQVQVFRYDPTLAAGTETAIGTFADNVATVGAYEARRLIQVTGMTEVISKRQYQYYARFRFEGGANAVLGSYVNAIEYDATVTYIPAGG